ncbi:MAG: hypothetical protein N2Z74_08305, partial [Syntrophales bacterium]|nr:hypothetical protein [Syntrophales bacterium]
MVGKDRNRDKPSAATSPDLRFHPFGSLKNILAAREGSVRHVADPAQETAKLRAHPRGTTAISTEADDERELFFTAMQGVRPLAAGKERETSRPEPPMTARVSVAAEEQEVLERLTRLVTTGEDFILSLTPEYLEGTGYNVHAEYARRLHAGDFSIQDHLD